VYALDLEPPPADTPPGVTYIRSDLNRALPFRGGCFDSIACVEGIEHIENPPFLLREFARVLKPHGTLLLTTPTITSLRSRLKFLLFGYYDGFRRRTLLRHVAHGSWHGHAHVNPVHLQFLYFWLKAGAFEEIRVHSFPARGLSSLLLAPLGLLIAALTKAPIPFTTDAVYSEYARLLASRAALFCPTLIVSARKAARPPR